MDAVREENLYRTVWRWHFYAGLFCVPFILWLSATGGLYLFKPQIEAMIDRPYAGLQYTGPLASPSAQAGAAMAAAPGSVLHRFVLPDRIDQATQIVVGKGAEETRIYIHPQTLAVLNSVGEEDRLMRLVFRLHGELMAGAAGSLIVELAASWAIVMLLTGLFLWWPRSGAGLAGTVYPRLRRGKAAFWRDLHAVTGIWISLLAIFLILTGLPWANNWGNYLKAVRGMAASYSEKQDWSAGSAADARDRAALDRGARMMMGEHAEHGGMVMAHAAGPLGALDLIVPRAQALNLAEPVEISPPAGPDNMWLVKSNAANRPLRTTIGMDGNTGEIMSREDFGQRPFIDRVIGIGVAAHEGALFGWVNQAIGLVTVLGLILLALSAIVMWWRRRPGGALGAPSPQGMIRHSWLLVGLVVALAFLAPLFGVSLAVVIAFERLLLRRAQGPARWLGLRAG
ncbi:PepSY-associated TM helix domain-containing protein [Sphingobium phenoxybenzoativorans]|uniref:PepSY-associated TM helix domain-containing protein n=1 Tax=Sphingobium phenoxybenzoativorans TaxID=1592790 RepID=UPI000871B9C0|nr:PepSY domain-containing protein [Sphingobium phenoxybenzoativorans]